MPERTSQQRRELIHELLTEELREEEGPETSVLVTSWVAFVGVHSVDQGEDEEDYGWVARVTSYPTPPSYVMRGLIETDRDLRLALMVKGLNRDDS